MRNTLFLFSRISLLCLILGFSFTLNAQSYKLDWAEYADTLSGGNGAREMKVDADGNSIILGFYTDSLQFNSQNEEAYHFSTHIQNLYIMKMDSLGTILWNKSIDGKFIGTYQPGNPYSHAFSLHIDNNNDILITARVAEYADLDPDTTEYSLDLDEWAIFVLKLDSEGSFVWANVIPVDEHSYVTSNVTDITSDEDGLVYVSGEYKGEINFTPEDDDNVYNSTVHTGSFPYNSHDAFLLCLTSEGSFNWVKTIIGEGENQINKILVDENKNIYSFGTYSKTPDFDPNLGIFTITAGGGYNRNGFIQKLDSLGNFVWAKNINGQFPGLFASSLILGAANFDLEGNLLFSGHFSNSLDFDPDTSDYIVEASGVFDMFINKLDTAGNFMWVKIIGGTTTAYPADIMCDSEGNILSIGRFEGKIDFDPGVDTKWMDAGLGTSLNLNTDIFILKLDSEGEYIWAGSLGESRLAGGSSLGVDAEDDIYACGVFIDSLDILPGYADSMVYRGESSIILKLDPCTPTYGVDTILACGQIRWIDGKYYEENDTTASFTITNAAGCDSIVRLHLTIGTERFYYVRNGCDSYTWFDSTYTVSNSNILYLETNETGCLDIHYLDLTINNSYAEVEEVDACESYVWIDDVTYNESTDIPFVSYINEAGCDSSIHLNLSIFNPYEEVESVVTCDDSYTWIDGLTYYASTDEPSIVYSSAGSCDSTIYLDLEINSVDVSTSATNTVITASLENAEYQWLICNETYSEIEGETGQSFSPQENGNYAVAISQNNCSDTSACISMTALGIDALQTKEVYSIYPNPVRDILYIGNALFDGDAYIYTQLGRQLYSHSGALESIDVSFLPAGVYVLELRSTGGQSHFPFVKE